ncbi:MAG: hypothetical protein NC094_07685 [Bacteroidales bacterium]|nr:hypothetical protein [Lachnoclostridium sp.]MCM1384705.1 hypothetical protein [Lachnoclostridium sp.]MCM1465281.1 hypothetical protein [Bacteroidales bacterium]
MKNIERKIGEFFCERMLKPIRSKQDIILLLLETLKLVSGTEESVSNESGRVIIHVDKMSRIFYITKEKYFSLCFPFTLEKRENNSYRIYDNVTDLEITDQMISLLISILKKSRQLGESLENMMDLIIESAQDCGYLNIDDIWKVLFKLWYMEDGYIRYDYDLKHENLKQHPLYHLDVNYSSGVTYKLGLKNSLHMNEFKDLLDVTTECMYL